ncbi:MAG TPA: hypothetical protein PL110_15320 [Candidatus Eremiobacteraeota bacterium]|nr:MAG: hypothetical protein BWY64_03387 [bacterium ADurb.Bin363]HPZ09474.1 hypothetical protein [Candidatus Eremiobacteraeota bacterium]
MSKITIFCQECGEPNSDENTCCNNCGTPIEVSPEFLEEITSAPIETRFDVKTLIPGVQAGAIAGVVSGLIWGLFRLFIFSAMFSGSTLSFCGMTFGGIVLLAVYIGFNIFCGILTGCFLSFFNVIHDIIQSRFISIIVNIIIALVIAFPVMLLQTLATRSTVFLFIGFFYNVLSGIIGGTLFSITIPFIYNQYFSSKY